MDWPGGVSYLTMWGWGHLLIPVSDYLSVQLFDLQSAVGNQGVARPFPSNFINRPQINSKDTVEGCL